MNHISLHFNPDKMVRLGQLSKPVSVKKHKGCSSCKPASDKQENAGLGVMQSFHKREIEGLSL